MKSLLLSTWFMLPFMVIGIIPSSLSRYDHLIFGSLLSGPRQGLVMLRVRETIAESLFNAGEILVTEVKLELDGQFGFGMVIGNQPRKALALALVDAALRKN